MSSTPHLIIIMADQLRFDALGPHTPNISRLLSESVRFPNGYCASPLCVPARGSFYTGLYPNETGSIINPWDPLDAVHGDVRAGIPNLYTLMERQWDSWHVGKQHFFTHERIHDSPSSATKWITIEKDYAPFLKREGQRAPGGPRFRGIVPEMVRGRTTRMKRYSLPSTGVFEPGFERFFDGFIARNAVEALKRRDPSRPLLLNVTFVAPHPPYDIPEPWHSMIGEVALPENVGRWYPDQSPLQLYNYPGVVGARYTREDWARIWPVYLGLVALLDHCVGMILEEIERQGILEESLILFTSDHGEMLGSHCLYQKMCMYEESVRTPFAFRFPARDHVKPAVMNERASGIDIFPTLCEYLGIRAPARVSGRSLMPAIRGSRLAERSVFVQFDGNGARGNFQRAMISGSHKLIVDLFKDEVFLELYDIGADPQETRNLIFDGRDALARAMLDELRQHMEDTGDLMSLPDGLPDAFLDDYGKVRGARARGART